MLEKTGIKTNSIALTPMLPFFYCENFNIVCQNSIVVQRQCMKHVNIDIHFIQDEVCLGLVCIIYSL